MQYSRWQFTMLDWFWYSAWIAVGLAWWLCCLKVIGPHMGY